MRTVDQVIAGLPAPAYERLPAPAYTGTHGGPRVMMAMEGMRRHVTDEGWQQSLGLQHAGYRLVGNNIEKSETHTPSILVSYQPATLVIQDKREWDGRTAGRRRDSSYAFDEIGCLRERSQTFKLTVLKDAHQDPEYHRESAEEMGVHGWVIYYHPRIFQHLAPYLRPEHCIRTYHTVAPEAVPDFSEDRNGCLLSGAVLQKVYPLRSSVLGGISRLPDVTYLKHPGYHRGQCSTNDYLKALSRHKVAICTSSIYGYAVRKIIEATACGCRVITDLPDDDVLPVIDDNLVRVSSSVSTKELTSILRAIYDEWDPEQQRARATEAQIEYSWCTVGQRLAANIEQLRQSYGSKP